MKKRFYLLLFLAPILFVACGTSEPPKAKSSRACDSETDCLPGYSCQANTCNLCMACLVIGETRCNETGQVEICASQSDGCTVWSAHKTCEDDKICREGRCTPKNTTSESCTDLCIQGDKRCVEGMPYLCTKPDKCTVWSKQDACASDKVCQEGSCIAKPTHPAGQKPEITKFTSDFKLHLPEEPVVLTWEVKNAAYVILRPLGLSVSPSGYLIVKDTTDITYTLEAHLDDQTTQESITIKRNLDPDFNIAFVELSRYMNGLEMVLLGREEFCAPTVELQLPDGKMENIKMAYSSQSNGGRIHKYAVSWKLDQEGTYKYRILVTKTQDTTDCSTLVVKRWHYPEIDSQGSAPWETFSYKKSGATTEPPPTCKEVCKSGERRCNGQDYQVCEKSFYDCYVWSAPIACPKGSKCVADGAACFTTDAPVDRLQKEIKVNPGTFNFNAGLHDNYKGTPTTISQSFYMWKHEFTIREYIVLMKPKGDALYGPESENLPQSLGSSYAMFALNELSKQYNLPPCYTCTVDSYQNLNCGAFPQYKDDAIIQCQGYRFPTLKEWQYAYRAGTNQDFYNGNLRSQGEETNPYLDAIGWYRVNSGGKAHPVGLKQPNAWGFYDMAGNVGEYFSDGEIVGGGHGVAPRGCTSWGYGYGYSAPGFRPVRTAP